MTHQHQQEHAKAASSPERKRDHAYTDDQLETIAAAFGSHLIRNAPPRTEHGIACLRASKLMPR